MNILKVFEEKNVSKEEFEFILNLLKGEKNYLEGLEKRYEIAISMVGILKTAADGGDEKAKHSLKEINSHREEVEKSHNENIEHLKILESLISKLDIL